MAVTAAPPAARPDAAPPLPDRRRLLRRAEALRGRDGLTAAALRWNADAPARRRALAEEAGRLAAPRVWPDTIASLAKTGWRVVAAAAPDAPLHLLTAAAAATGLPIRPPSSSTGAVERAQRLVRAGGPAYVKLGQFVASARGLLPDPWVEGFAWCRDEAPPLPDGTVQRILERELGADVLARLDVDPEPLAAGSIGQVHRATLAPEDGDGAPEDVVVKVRRPGLRGRFRRDVECLALVAAVAERTSETAAAANLPGFVDLFARLALEELDFRLEACNLTESVAILEDLGAGHVRVPRPFPGLVTERVLVMEAVPGVAHSRLADTYGAELDGDALLRLGIGSVLEATLVHGVFHGDMHAGNVLVDSEGGFSMVDFGICGRLDAGERAGLVRFLLAFAASDAAGQVEAMRAFGAIDDDADVAPVVAQLQAEIDRIDARDAGTVTFDRLGETLGRLLAILAAGGFRMPTALVLFFKNLLYMTDFAASVAPDADLLEVVSTLLADLLGGEDGALAAIVAGGSPAAAPGAAEPGPVQDVPLA